MAARGPLAENRRKKSTASLPHVRMLKGVSSRLDLSPPDSPSRRRSVSPGELDAGGSHADHRPRCRWIHPHSLNRCGAVFDSSEQLETHLFGHMHEETTHKCAHMVGNANWKAELSKSWTTFDGDPDWVELVNNKKATDEKAWRCRWEECPKFFNDPIAFGEHLRQAHSKYRPYPCKVPGCDRTFFTLHAAKVHLNSHYKHADSALQHVCDIAGCFEVFATKQQLKDHDYAHKHRQHRCAEPKCRWCYVMGGAGSKGLLNKHTDAKRMQELYAKAPAPAAFQQRNSITGALLIAKAKYDDLLKNDDSHKAKTGLSGDGKGPTHSSFFQTRRNSERSMTLAQLNDTAAAGKADYLKAKNADGAYTSHGNLNPAADDRFMQNGTDEVVKAALEAEGKSKQQRGELAYTLTGPSYGKVPGVGKVVVLSGDDDNFSGGGSGGGYRGGSSDDASKTCSHAHGHGHAHGHNHNHSEDNAAEAAARLLSLSQVPAHLEGSKRHELGLKRRCAALARQHASHRGGTRDSRPVAPSIARTLSTGALLPGQHHRRHRDAEHHLQTKQHHTSKDVKEWDCDTVLRWLRHVNLLHAIPIFEDQGLNGRDLLDVTNDSARTQLLIENKFHRRKLLMAIESIRENGLKPSLDDTDLSMRHDESHPIIRGSFHVPHFVGV